MENLEIMCCKVRLVFSVFNIEKEEEKKNIYIYIYILGSWQCGILLEMDDAVMMTKVVTEA